MARRNRHKGRREPQNNDLDLHGERHENVDRLVENHILMNELPLKIITGNSFEMHRIVKSVLDRHEFKYEVGDDNNKGYIYVFEY